MAVDLAYPLDDTVEIDGKTYKLDLSFDNVLRLIDMLNDDELNDITQINLGLEMLLGEKLDYDIAKKEQIFHDIFKATIGKGAEKNQLVDIEGNPMPQPKQERIFSLKQDAPYIFAAFYQNYGIDLFEMHGKLHWEKFNALFTALFPNSNFKEIVEIRASELPIGKGMHKERERLRKLNKYYELKDEVPYCLFFILPG